MTQAMGELVKTWVDEVVGKNQDLEEEVKTLTLELENFKRQVQDLQSKNAKIRDLEEEVKVLKSVLSGGEKDTSDLSNTCVLLEENKSLRLEQLELTVRYQMGKMWEMINLHLKANTPPAKQEKHKQIELQQLISTTIPQQEEVPEDANNPLKIILDKIFDSLSLSCLFKCRRVCKLWNNIAVTKINQNGNNTRLLRIVDPRGGTIHGSDEIDIKEILATMETGRLEYSTCTNIYFDYSMKFNPSAFEKFLALIGKNIKILHYGGNNISELNKILKMCAQNLEILSLWQLQGCRPSKGSRNGLYEKDEDPKLVFPKLENVIFVSDEDGNRYIRLLGKMKHVTYYSYSGLCNPSLDFLLDIFEASPKLNSLSCRLYGSRILKALTQTNSYSKLTSLCLKSRVGIPQLRSLVSAMIRLKILSLEGFCVTTNTYSDDNLYDESGRRLNLGPDDPELMEFGSLLLEFLKSQASTVEYLKLDLFTERNDYPDIPTDVLFNHFPRMPNLITLVVGNIDQTTHFPFELSTFAELFPKLKNLQHIPFHDCFDGEDYKGDIHEFEEALQGYEEFPANYPMSPNASFSLENIRNVDISPNLTQFFPFITELHLDGNIGIIHKIPFCLPRLKHFYHVVDIDFYCEDEEDNVLKLIRVLNSFMVGISPEECQRAEEEHEEHHAFGGYLSRFKFARTRPSIFDLDDLETLDFTFSCACKSRGRIFSAIEVMIAWGLSRMKYLKKLRFQFEQKVKVNSGNGLPNSHHDLLAAFRDRNNLETHSKGYTHFGSSKEIRIEKIWYFELNLNHHTSEWNQIRFSEDPDIWDLG